MISETPRAPESLATMLTPELPFHSAAPKVFVLVGVNIGMMVPSGLLGGEFFITVSTCVFYTNCFHFNIIKLIKKCTK